MVDFIKKLYSGVVSGIGWGLGITLVLFIIVGVYAFVEPTQDPEVGDNYMSKTSSLSGIKWAGYTSNTDNSYVSYGGYEGIRAVNKMCDDQYSGSRAMLYEDFKKIRNDGYPYSQETWVVDGMKFAGYSGTVNSDVVATKDMNDQYMGDYDDAMGVNCEEFSDDTNPGFASYMNIDGKLRKETCSTSSTRSFPCVYGN